MKFYNSSSVEVIQDRSELCSWITIQRNPLSIIFLESFSARDCSLETQSVQTKNDSNDKSTE